MIFTACGSQGGAGRTDRIDDRWRHHSIPVCDICASLRTANPVFGASRICDTTRSDCAPSRTSRAGAANSGIYP
jgi:hypothetical protein